MQTILIASSKGGAGKSTLATNLAAHFAEGGKNTALVDQDPQRSSLGWCERRPNDVPGVLGIDGTRRRWREQLPADTQRVIIDTPAGSRARDLAETIEHADVLLVPILPSAFDLDAARGFLEGLGELPRIKRGKIATALVANRIKPWTNQSRDGLETMAALGFPVIVEIRDTGAYALMAGLGKGVFDYASENARAHQDNFAPLLRWLKKHG